MSFLANHGMDPSHPQAKSWQSKRKASYNGQNPSLYLLIIPMQLPAYLLCWSRLIYSYKERKYTAAVYFLVYPRPYPTKKPLGPQQRGRAVFPWGLYGGIVTTPKNLPILSRTAAPPGSEEAGFLSPIAGYQSCFSTFILPEVVLMTIWLLEDPQRTLPDLPPSISPEKSVLKLPDTLE